MNEVKTGHKTKELATRMKLEQVKGQDIPQDQFSESKMPENKE